jgi:hypothetical protein
MRAEQRVLPARSADGMDAHWPQVALPLLSHRCQQTFRVKHFVWPWETQPGPPAIVIAEVTEREGGLLDH